LDAAPLRVALRRRYTHNRRPRPKVHCADSTGAVRKVTSVRLGTEVLAERGRHLLANARVLIANFK